MGVAHNTKDFETHKFPTWCPGCGDFGIWTALKQALVELGKEPHQVVVVFGIGCSGNQANFVRAYGFHGLHGRALPVATGISLANHGVTTIVVGGDGDGYGEGLAHFVHTMRANPNITYLVHDNQVYGLTKGQTSPTSSQGFKTDSTPAGSLEEPINPIAIALAADCGYVARGFAGDVTHLQKLIVDGVNHKGFSLIDVFQPCVTFNHLNTFSWYYQRVAKLEEMGHNPADRNAAWIRATEASEKLPIGLFFQQEKPTYQDGLPQLAGGPLVAKSIERVDLTELFATFQ